MEVGEPRNAGEVSRCVVAGCGPAGAVLALLLVRAGVEVLVLEKHGDFLRDSAATPSTPPRSRCSTS